MTNSVVNGFMANKINEINNEFELMPSFLREQ